MYNEQVRKLAIDLLTQQTDRDKQRKVGASQISDPCSKHLAAALVSEPEGTSKYWLGAKLGTATHLLLEGYVESSDFPEVSDAVIEEKITLGELPDYGTISSKPDLVLPSQKHLIDWKTSTRAKSNKLQSYIDNPSAGNAEAEYTMRKYMAQTQLYAWGVNNAGTPIENISLVFINRDGSSERDVWSHTFEYNQEFAVSLWTRLERIWAELEAGKSPGEFAGDPSCFKCKVGL